MADNLFFSRDTRVIVSDGTKAWEIPVLDGFSFSQATNTSEITLNEMEGAGGSRRGRRMFNDSYAPAEWSFSTYVRPFKGGPVGAWTATDWDGGSAGANVHAVEEALWAAFVGKGVFTHGSASTNSSWDDNITNAATMMTVDFLGSNTSSLATLDIYFVMGQGTFVEATHTIYKLEDGVVNSAGIDFDLDGIATINWAGFASKIIEIQTLPTHALPAAAIKEGTQATNNFIRNRLSTLVVATGVTGVTSDGSDVGLEASYALTLTGGSLNFENNITFLTPETLGVINVPIGHVTGTRNIGGSFTCYLSNSTGAGADLWEDLIEADKTLTNSFSLTFSIGGTSGSHVIVTLPTCHLEIPTHSIEDVISLETTFHALPSTINSADEATIVYKGPVTGL